MELVFDFIFNTIKSNFENKYEKLLSRLIDSSIKLMDEEEKFDHIVDTTNIGWLLEKAKNYYSIEDLLSTVENFNFISNEFLSFSITKLPDTINYFDVKSIKLINDIMENMVDRVINDPSLNNILNDMYYMLDKYVKNLGGDYMRNPTQTLFHFGKYSEVLSLFKKYGDDYSYDFLYDLKEQADVNLKEKWSQDLSDLIKYLETMEFMNYKET